MKATSSVCIALCGTMLAGCAALSGGEVSQWKIPPRIVMTADGEYLRGKQLHLMGEYNEAQKAYLSALVLNPDHADAKNGMAALIGASGDLDRAIGMLIALGRQYPASHVFANLGHAYQMQGRDFEARDAYERALSLDPGNLLAQQRLQALDQKLGAESPSAAITEPAVVDEPPANAVIDPVTSGVYALRYPPGPSAVPMPQIEERPARPAVSAEPQQAPVTTTQIPTAPMEAMPVELVNGNGVNGFARGLRQLLPADTWQVVRATNHRDFKVGRTRIEYVEDHAPAAHQMAEELGLRPRLALNNQQAGTRLKVILGHDCKDLEWLRHKLNLAASGRKSAS